MKSTLKGRILGVVTGLAVIGLTLGTATVHAATAAGTTKGAKIANQAKAEYLDASGKGPDGTAGTVFRVKSTLVEVNVLLLAAAPTFGSETVSTNPVDSGGTVTHTYDIFSNANGTDTYKLSFSAFAQANTTSRTVSYSVTNAAGGAGPTGSASGAPADSAAFSIGAATIVGNTATNTIYVPKGTAEANGIDDGDTIIIETGAGTYTKYTVKAVTTSATGATWNNGTNVLDPEVPDSITLYDVGTADDADFPFAANFLVGRTASELLTVVVSATAVADPTAVQGTVDISLKAVSQSTGNPETGVTATTQSKFNSSQLSITKTVKNAAGDDISVATGSGGAKPGDVLYYRLTITLSGSPANKVNVTDLVPKYTKLLSYTDGTAFDDKDPLPAYDNTKIIARIERTTGLDLKAVYLTGNNNAEVQGGGLGEVGFGENLAGVADAGSTLVIHVGDNSTKDLGGTVLNTETYIIDYRVQVL